MDKRSAFALFIALVVVFGVLLDFLYTTFVEGGAFAFPAASSLVISLAVGIAVGYIVFLRGKGN